MKSVEQIMQNYSVHLSSGRTTQGTGRPKTGRTSQLTSNMHYRSTAQRHRSTGEG